MTYSDPFHSSDAGGQMSQPVNSGQPGGTAGNPAPTGQWNAGQWNSVPQSAAPGAGQAYGQGGYQQYPGTGPVLTAQPVQVRERSIQRSVAAAYAEMAVGLVITALVAWFSASSGLILSFLQAAGNIGWWGLLIGQVILAVVLGARALKMSPGLARALFYVYAATMGFTLSTIFFVFNLGTIGLALALTAGFFICLTMIGLTTKANLLKAGPILMVGLVVLIVSQVVLALFQVSGATMIMAAITLVLFAGLTAYDAQRTRALYQQLGTSEVMIRRISILAALNLYLDFINMFLALLQIFGSRN